MSKELTRQERLDAEIRKSLDARTKEFKEKIQKLTYEKIKKALVPSKEPLKGYPHNESVEEKVTCPKCEGKGCDHCDGNGYHESVDLEGRDYDEFIPLSDITLEGIFSEPEWEINNQEGGFDDLYEVVLEKMEHLPAIYKDILMDREIHKMKYQEIADKYSMKKRAIATRIRRARIKIREMFPGIKLNFID